MSAQEIGVVVGSAVLIIASLLFVSLPVYASAATYAYVDASGEVKSVTATDWQSAINLASNIHAHSGVLLLSTASDYTIVGDNVPAF